MTIYSFGGYPPNAYWVSADGRVQLDPDFDASTDARYFEVEDDDGVFDGGGDDSRQYGRTYDADGTLLSEGPVNLDAVYVLDDGNGNVINVYGVGSDGEVSGWIADGPIVPGVSYTQTGPHNLDSSNAPAYADLHTPTEDPDDANTYHGGIHGDDLRTGAQADTVDGGAGNDTISSGAGNDSVDGGSGHDWIEGGSGADTIDGADGNETIYYGTGGDSVSGGSGDDLIDDHHGTNHDVWDDTLDGGAGNDTIFAGAGEDWVTGGDGDDLIMAEDGDDTLDGGSGHDTIYGDGGADAITGGHGDDTLYGGAGNDTVHGDGGNDHLSGGEGDDFIAGGEGDDTLDGGGGDDRLDGGTGSNTMTGGAGQDTFAAAPGSANTVTDFDIGDHDGDGTYNDQLDVSGLRTPAGDPVHVWNVVVSDDGSGNALLTFPEGETIVLHGVSPAQMTSPAQMRAAGIPCFTRGTMIATPTGEVPVEHLQPGDLVQTRDNGAQQVMWTSRRHIGRAALLKTPKLRPIHIAEGTFGNSRAVRVSPQHALPLSPTGGGAAGLVRAGHAARLHGGGIRVAQGVRAVTYVHIMLEAHQIVFANGIAAESFYPGPCGLRALGLSGLSGIARVLPGLARHGASQAYGGLVHPTVPFKALPANLCDLRMTS